jgi:glycosyltransferase involved in cell wall biosynthesis
MLGFLFRHYDSWIDRYIVHDDGSTDGSIEILKAHPRVELRKFKRIFPEAFSTSNQKLENSVWKESRGRADWVIFIDTDEHLFVPGIPMRDYLSRCMDQGVTMLPSLGYQMISEDYPNEEEQLCYTRTLGAPFRAMSKMSIFNPEAIIESNCKTGRHTANPVGHIKLAKRDELLLLHYKNLGYERTWERQKSLYSRHSQFTQSGTYPLYAWGKDRFRAMWDEIANEAIDISIPDLKPWRTHIEKRWWRKDLKYFAFRKYARFLEKRKRKSGKVDDLG